MEGRPLKGVRWQDGKRWSWSSIKRAVLCRSLSMYLRSDGTPTPVWDVYATVFFGCFQWVRVLPVKSFFVSAYTELYFFETA